MKRILISEEERERILGMHKKNFLNENPSAVTNQTTQNPGVKPTATKIMFNNSEFLSKIPQIKNQQQFDNFVSANILSQDLLGVNAYQAGWTEQTMSTPEGRNGWNSIGRILDEALAAHAISGDVTPKKTLDELFNFIKQNTGIDSAGITQMNQLVQSKGALISNRIADIMKKYNEILQQKLQSIGYASSQSTTPQPNKPY